MGVALVKQNAELTAIVHKLLAASPVQAAPGREQAVGKAVEDVARGAAAGDTRLRQALDFLKVGKVAEATPLLQTYATDESARIAQDSKDAAAAWRNLGAIAGLRDPRKAREAYAKAAALDPGDAEGLSWDGWFQLEANNLAAAEKSYRALLALEGADASQLFWARSGLGDIAKARGDLKAALANYGEARVAMERLAKSDGGNADWQYDLGISNERIGDVQMKQGNLAAALKSYEAKRDIISRLDKSDAGNADWQRDLSVSYNKIGDVLVAQGALGEALKSYRDSHAIFERRLMPLRPVRSTSCMRRV